MTKNKIRDIITKIHFYLLGIVLLNFALKSTIEISLNYTWAHFLILIVYASGIILFFWNFMPFKSSIIYYSFYFITQLVILIFWLFGGIFLAILSSAVLYPIYPNEIEAENEKIVIYTKYQGFMGSCCRYELTEKKYLILEEKIMEINLDEEIDFKKASIKSVNGNSELKIKYDKYDHKTEQRIKTDTIIEIKTE